MGCGRAEKGLLRLVTHGRLIDQPWSDAVTLHQKPNTLPTDSFWMPFTANRQFKKAPRLFASAEGMHYTTVDGRKVIDGSAGLWCVNAGHGRRQIATAVERQLMNLDFAPSFNMGHPLAFDFAERLAEIAPKGIDRIFFTNSGSESVDTALKIALAYQRAAGQAARTRLIGRERGYHGVGFGGMSVGGMVANRRAFATHLPGVDHIRHTHDLARNAFAKDLPEHGADLAEDLQRAVDLCGADNIAACIVEPIAASTGCLVPPKGYLKRLREICDKHGILLIFDEVICGFGRTGKAFGAQSFEVTPDIMTMAKGLTNAAIPMGAVAFKDKIYQTVTEATPGAAVEFFHGYTYSGHPVACAAGLAALDIYKKEGLFERAAALSAPFLDAVFSLRDVGGITDIRGYGMIAAFDLAPAEKPGQRGYQTMIEIFEAGVLTRVIGDTVLVAPPFIVEDRHIDQMATTLRKVLTRH